MPGLCAVASVEHSGRPEVRTSPARPVVVAGSGAGLVSTSLLADVFRRTHPGMTIGVYGGMGSLATLRAASDGLVAVGLVSQPLRGVEKAWGLTVLPYARTAIVCAVHPTVAEDEITAGDLVQMYQGVKTHWRDGREVVLLTREPGANAVEVMEREVPGFAGAYRGSRLSKRSITLYSDQEMNRVVARTPAGLGLTDLGVLTREALPIKVLRFNGIFPIPESIRSGLYPLVKTLAFAFVKERLPDDAMAFLEFARSKDGERVLRANGYQPVA